MTTANETVAVGEQWDTSKYASKEHLLEVVRDSAVEFFDLVEAPDHWEVQITPDPVGFRVSGRNGGTWKVTVGDGAFQFEPAPVDDLPTVFEFDAASFVLTSFARNRGGTAYGDTELANHFRGTFFAI